MRNIIITTAFALFIGSSHAELTTVDYTDTYDNDFALQGFVSIPEDSTPAPAVVIIPDFTGVNDYEKARATMLTEQYGWVAFAADIYGKDFNGTDMAAWAGQSKYYKNDLQLFYSRIQAAVDVVKNHSDVMSDKIAVIGYCFGGTGILAYSFLGATDIVGAVSFHGGLLDFSVNSSIHHPVLVLSGGADDTGTAVETLENSLNEANSTWQITRYSGIEHAFTVFPEYTPYFDSSNYNELADKRSWHEMGTFLQEAFGELEYDSSPPTNMSGIEAVNYTDNGFVLAGYLAVPENAVMGKTPAVVIVPGGSGNGGSTGYAAERAKMLADMGYVAFVSDIYGPEYEYIEDRGARKEMSTPYRTNYTLFVSRIQAAVDIVANHELVNEEEIALIGHCFGGTGAVDYAFSDVTLKSVKVVVPFHGGLTGASPILTDDIYPYVLVQSGGEDDAHGNNTELEIMLDEAQATWEITRYSDTYHGFTDWDDRGYNALADWRSWDAMTEILDMYLQDADADADADADEESMATIASNFGFLSVLAVSLAVAGLTL